MPASPETRRTVKCDPFVNVVAVQEQLDLVLDEMAEAETVVAVGFGMVGPRADPNALTPYVITDRGIHFTTRVGTAGGRSHRPEFVARVDIANGDGMIIPYENEATAECYSHSGEIIFQLTFTGDEPLPAAEQLDRFAKAIASLGSQWGSNTGTRTPR